MTARDTADDHFLTERRVLGLVGASIVATAGYWLVTPIGSLEALLFFVVFLAVFAGLNYAVFRYD